MLYTLSHATYDYDELADLIHQLQPKDKLILWQNAVLLPLKYPALFSHHSRHIHALENDVIARGIAINYPLTLITLSDFITITEHYCPHFGL